MERFDTLKLGLSTKSLNSYNENLFTIRTDTDPETGEMEECLILKDEIRNKTLGITRFIINLTNETVELEFSAKALKAKYLEGINKNTIPIVFDHLRTEGIADFNFDMVMDSAKVFKIDIVANLKLSKPLEEYLRVLKLLAHRGNYYLVFHKTGVEILSTAKTNDFRLKIYSKHPEMSDGLDSQGHWSIKEIIKYIPLSEFEDILRFELSLRTFSEIRSAFGLPDSTEIRLMPLLLSDMKVLHNAFLKSFNTDFLKSEPFDRHAKSMTHNQKISRWGYMNLVEDFGGNQKLSNQFIDEEIKGGNYAYKRKVRQAITDNSHRRINSGFSLVKEIQDLLFRIS